MRRHPVFEPKNLSGDLGVAPCAGLESPRSPEIKKQTPSTKNQQRHHQKTGRGSAIFLDTVCRLNAGCLFEHLAKSFFSHWLLIHLTISPIVNEVRRTLARSFRYDYIPERER